MNQFTEFSKTEKSPSLLTNRVWWLGAGLLCYIKLYPQNTYLPATYVCIQGWSHSMFLLRKILFLTQAVRNQRCIEIEWTIQNCNPLRWLNHFWKVLDSCNCLWARKRTKMFYLFIYLFKKRRIYSLRIFPWRRNISPKTLRSSHISNLHKLEYCRSIFLEHIWSASNLAI